MSELKEPTVDNPAESKTPATGQTAAEHGAGITVRRHEQAVQPVEDPFRRDSSGQDSGRRGTAGDEGGTVTGSPGPGHPGVDTGRMSSADQGNGGQDQELDSRSDRGGVSAGPDEHAGERYEQASASAAAGTCAGQPAGHIGTDLDGGSPADASGAATDAATVDGQPVRGSVMSPDQEQVVSQPGTVQSGELAGTGPGPAAPGPGAGREGVSGHSDAGTVVIGDGEPASEGDAGNGGGGPFGPAVTGADASAGDTGGQGRESDVGRGAPGKPGAESSSQEQQGGETGKGTDAKDGEEPRPMDRALIQNPTPEAEVAQQGDTSSEAGPDQNAEDPRWAAVMSAIGDLQAQNQKLEQKIDSQQAESDAKLEAMQAKVDMSEAQHKQDQAKISELEDNLAARELESAKSADASESGEEPKPSGKPDVTKQGERDEGVPGGNPSTSDEADASAIDRRRTNEPGMEAHKAESRARKALSAENVGAAAAGVAAIQGVASIWANLPPEVGAASTVLAFAGAAMATSGAKRVYERWKDRNEH